MNLAALAERLGKDKIEYTLQTPMSHYTSFKIGGPADIFISVASEEELKTALLLCREFDVPFMTVGKGSNLLVSDMGIEGAVIHIAKGLDNIELIDETTVRCGAGASLSALCIFCKEHGLSGLEFAFGIPGSVGGAMFMNAGAYGGEMKDAAVSARYITPEGKIGEYKGEELSLSYRKSVFTGTDNVVLSADFSLKPDNIEDIKVRMDDYMERRKTKQPLSFPSAGSVFKRPEGYFAGALIEQSNLKGYSVGGAQVSEKHAGFIINVGGASCDDVTNLMAHIVDTVQKNFGVTLEPEIIKIGR